MSLSLLIFRKLWLIIAFFFVLFLLVIIFFLVQYRTGYLINDSELLIEQGDSFDKVVQTFSRQGVSGDLFLLKLVARLYGTDQNLGVGLYRFASGVTFPKLLERLNNQETDLLPIRIVEGVTIGEVMRILESNSLLRGRISSQPLAVLPDTYLVEALSDRQEILNRMSKALEDLLARQWRARKLNLPLKSPEEMLVLASIVEKETAKKRERGKIAGVFINRLRKSMRLQSDPTVIYALKLQEGRFNRALTRKDLKVDSPYNTYRFKGLPPSPISMPSLDSIKATSIPDEHDYLYFVADGKGGHNFAKNLEEHNFNVRLFRSL